MEEGPHELRMSPMPPPPPPSSPPFDLTRHSRLGLRRSASPLPRNPSPRCRRPSDAPLTPASHHRAASAPPARSHAPLPSARKLAASLWEHHQQAPISTAFPHRRDKLTSVVKGQRQAITIIRPVSARNDNLQQTDAEAGLFRNMRTHEWPKKKHAAVVSNKLPLAEPGEVESPDFLVKVLNRIKILEDQQKTNISIVAALRMELEHARIRVQELDIAQKLACKEFNDLLNEFAEETTAIHIKEQEKINAAVLLLREELEQEHRARRRHDARNVKLSRNLSQSNKGLRRAVMELEKEKKSRKLMEGVCEELAKEIAKDKSQVEELKRRLAGVRMEVEEERKMLKMAEVWREERVQMKLEDARLELEERKQAVETLRSKLEEFLKLRR